MKNLAPIAILLTPTFTTSSTLSCINGFTKNESIIPASKINDGYCDCLDGSDELLTDACAGTPNWSGTRDISEEDGSNNKDDHMFKCLQQTLILPLSHLNDGICDCCDGSDEPTAYCDDICDSVLAEERRLKKELADNFYEGNKKREGDIKDFRRAVKETMEEIHQMKEQIVPLETIIKDKEAIYEEEKEMAFSQHLENVSLVQDEFHASGGSEAFTQNEIMEEFIAASCQLYGEAALAHSNKNFSKEKFCDPLRRAAMDVGILWDGDKNVKIGTSDDIFEAFMKKENILTDSEESKEWVDPEDAILDEYHGRDSYADDDDFRDHDDDDYYGDDDYGDKDEDMHRSKRNRKPHKSEEEKNDFSMDIADSEEYKTKFRNLMRSPFLEASAKVLSRIDDLLKVTDTDDREEDEENDQVESDVSSNFDPMAVQMVRNKLSSRVSQVQYGQVLGGSAKFMLKGLEELTDESQYSDYLEKLVVGVINLSFIGEADVEEILTVINADVSDDSCYSPYATLCSNEYAKESVLKRCSGRSDPNLCQDLGDLDIPSNISDGYFNYYVPEARGQHDPLTEIFASYKLNIFENTNVSSLGQEIQDARQKVEQLKKDTEKKKEEKGLISSKDGPPKFGKSGELYALRDECFDIYVAKYTYQLCLFERAYQREGAAKTGGTDLGKWDSANIIKGSSTRVWKWKNGAKCWNGPKRSATVFVTCGAEMKLISADEPNICEYEFRMEGYIGCDDKFKTLHDL